MYPKPDRSAFQPNFVKTPENDVLDISWNEGQLADGRPYRMEFWCQDQVSVLTYFFSTKGLENATAAELKALHVREGLVSFLSDRQYVSSAQITDAGSHEMWSVNVVVGDDENTFITGGPPIKRYDRPPPAGPGPALGSVACTGDE